MSDEESPAKMISLRGIALGFALFQVGAVAFQEIMANPLGRNMTIADHYALAGLVMLGVIMWVVAAPERVTPRAASSSTLSPQGTTKKE